MPEILLIRHAQSTWNAEGRWQGQSDPPLSPAGIEQVRGAVATLRRRGPAPVAAGGSDGTGNGQPAGKRWERFDVAVSSDLNRARSTAELLAAGLGLEIPVVVTPLLREMDAGAWGGRTRAEIAELWPGELARFDALGPDGPPGGESRAELDERMRQAVEQLAGIAAAQNSTRMLVVAHGAAIRSLARSSGLAEAHVAHLAGYLGRLSGGGLRLLEPVDLTPPPAGGGSGHLDLTVPSDHAEGPSSPGTPRSWPTAK